MENYLLPILGTVVLLLLALLVYFLWRVRHLLTMMGSSQCAARQGKNAWHTGVLFFREEDMEWFPIRSLSLKPKFSIQRRNLETYIAEDHDDSVIINVPSSQVRQSKKDISLAMARDVHTSMVAWADSALPQGEIVNFH